jgi:hypothetical protein
MKSLTYGIKEAQKRFDSKVVNAVVRRVGREAIEDIVNHGMDAGFSGFIYYSETHAFAMKYRKPITEMLEEMASDLGEDVVSMVSGFGVFRNSPMDADDRKDLYKYLGGGRPEQGTITNVMAWFAAEEVCRAIMDAREN